MWDADGSIDVHFCIESVHSYPGSNTKHTINAFCQICHCVEKRTKINKKEDGFGLFIAKTIFTAGILTRL